MASLPEPVLHGPFIAMPFGGSKAGSLCDVVVQFVETGGGITVFTTVVILSIDEPEVVVVVAGKTTKNIAAM